MVIVSLCLLGIPCRYDGKRLKPRKTLSKIKESMLPLCPEQLGGLPTPRKSAEIIKIGRKIKVINQDKKDVTENFKRGARITLELAKRFNIKKAYLKSKSPSCGENGITTRVLKKHGIQVYIVD